MSYMTHSNPSESLCPTGAHPRNRLTVWGNWHESTYAIPIVILENSTNTGIWGGGEHFASCKLGHGISWDISTGKMKQKNPMADHGISHHVMRSGNKDPTWPDPSREKKKLFGLHCRAFQLIFFDLFLFFVLNLAFSEKFVSAETDWSLGGDWFGHSTKFRPWEKKTLGKNVQLFVVPRKTYIRFQIYSPFTFRCFDLTERSGGLLPQNRVPTQTNGRWSRLVCNKAA